MKTAQYDRLSCIAKTTNQWLIQIPGASLHDENWPLSKSMRAVEFSKSQLSLSQFKVTKFEDTLIMKIKISNKIKANIPKNTYQIFFFSF